MPDRITMAEDAVNVYDRHGEQAMLNHLADVFSWSNEANTVWEASGIQLLADGSAVHHVGGNLYCFIWRDGYGGFHRNERLANVPVSERPYPHLDHRTAVDWPATRDVWKDVMRELVTEACDDNDLDEYPDNDQDYTELASVHEVCSIAPEIPGLFKEAFEAVRIPDNIFTAMNDYQETMADSVKRGIDLTNRKKLKALLADRVSQQG